MGLPHRGIGRSVTRCELTYDHARTGSQIHFVAVLVDPAAGNELGVDFRARLQDETPHSHRATAAGGSESLH